MALIITGSIISNPTSASYDDFYVRIDLYHVEKNVGNLRCIVGHYEDKDAAERMSPLYIEDYESAEASGYISYPISHGENVEIDNPHGLNFPLTSSEVVEVITYSSSYEDQLVDYIDYDDDGNEIVVQRSESIEVLHSSSANVSKSRIDLDIITGSVYDYSYSKVKDYYVNIFGAANVQDDI